jgi:ABC-type transport system involved in multi-copper enzyme maturation permease subunit
MIALLRAELLKLRTTRTFVALTASALALSLLVVVLRTTLSSDFGEQEVRDLFTGDFTVLFILLLGVMGMAGEWRHKTITSSVLAAPVRARLVAAKVLSYAVAGAVVSLIVTVAMMAVALPLLAGQGEPTLGLADLADVLWRNLAVAALLGSFGVCIGALVRSQVVAIVGLLVFSFVLEPAVLSLEPDVGRFGPTSGAPSGIQALDELDDFGGVDLLAPGIALLVMIGWVALGSVAAAAVVRRRDLV